MNGSAGQVPGKESQINIELNQLDKALEELHSVANDLGGKLQPLMRKEPTQEVGVGEKDSIQGCALASSLRGKRSKIHKTIKMLIGFRDRIEL